MNVEQYLKDVKAGNVSVVETIHKILEEIKRTNKEYNHFNVISEELALGQAKKIDKNKKGKLAGLPVSVKDSICVKDVESSAGSSILKNYIPPFNATCIQKAVDEGAIVIGKTSQDEFGFGSFSVNVGLDFKIPKNPLDKERTCGGSSGGAAGFTSLTKHPHIAFAESTGGSIAVPASFCGIAGLCPTYGAVSRYGLIDFSNSMDKVGPMAKKVSECKLLHDVIKGQDPKDPTSIDSKKLDSKVKKIGVVKEALGVDGRIKDLMFKKLDSLGIKYEEISLPISIKYGIPVYYLLATSEASTNLARYCGIRYGSSEELKGYYDEYFTNVRSKFLNKEAKRRIILGTFARMSGFRDAYYLKAAKVRTLIIEEYKKTFKEYDVLLSPTVSTIAPKFSDIDKMTPLQNYLMDLLTVSPNIAGLPHLSVNAGFIDKMPLGILFTSDHLNEEKLFSIGGKAE